MAEEHNGGRMPTLCGPDGLQKNSIERSVPQAEGAWSVFGYFLLTKKYQWPAFGWVFAYKNYNHSTQERISRSFELKSRSYARRITRAIRVPIT